MVNFGPLAAQIGPVVWAPLANIDGFRVLAALLHGTPVVGVSQTAALNRGRHLYSAGRPSRWAWAHIVVWKEENLRGNWLTEVNVEGVCVCVCVCVCVSK